MDFLLGHGLLCGMSIYLPNILNSNVSEQGSVPNILGLGFSTHNVGGSDMIFFVRQLQRYHKHIASACKLKKLDKLRLN